MIPLKGSIPPSTAKAVGKGIARGAVAIYPTDTLYALGASPLSKRGLLRVAELKKRPAGMPMSLAFHSVETALEWVDASPLAEEIMRTHLPGALTVVLPASKGAPRGIVSSDGTLGVRVPNHKGTLALLAAVGPMTATSANVHGGKDPVGIEEVPPEMVSKVDFFFEAGPSPLKRGSTVIKIIGERMTLLREGAVPFAKLEGR